ncbi:MAG: hypothetical protein VX938_01415, partial [Myxococcota bacterium]|nr:hypothetical protein [Myxococcota bacterium]
TRDPELRARLQAGLGAAYGRWAQDIERSEVAEAPATDQGLVDGPSGPSGPSAPTPADAALPRWERAVEHLERALTLRPDDPDVLRNLEVALLRVDPPCWARADEMEPNDVWEQAGQIELAAEEAAPQSGAQQAPAEGTQDRLTWTRQLLACPEDTDWFRVSLEPGDRLHARLTVPEGMGRLALSIHAPGASSRLRPPSSTETVLEELELTPGPGRGGEYLLQVSNLDGDEVSYGLEVEVRPPCQKTEDHLEDNDDPSAPAVLTPGPVDGLKLCPGDPDWYSVTLAEGESLFVYAELQPEEEEEDEEGSEEGDVEAQPGPGLELSVRGLDGTEISRGAPAGDSRVASVLDPGEGTFLVHIDGGPLEARYKLLVHVVPPCPDGDDEHEDNDVVEAAVDLSAAPDPSAGAGGPPQQEGPKTMLLRVCPGDKDWFRVTATPETPTVVSTIFEHAKGDLQLALYDEAGVEEIQVSDESTVGTNGERLALPPVEEETTYAFRVQGQGSDENFYLLRMDQPQGDGDSGESDEDEKKEDESEQEQEPQDKEESEEQTSPLQDHLDKMDHNPQNLEASQKRAASPRGPPEKDW